MNELVSFCMNVPYSASVERITKREDTPGSGKRVLLSVYSLAVSDVFSGSNAPSLAQAQKTSAGWGRGSVF